MFQESNDSHSDETALEARLSRHSNIIVRPNSHHSKDWILCSLPLQNREQAGSPSGQPRWGACDPVMQSPRLVLRFRFTRSLLLPVLYQDYNGGKAPKKLFLIPHIM